MIHPEQNASSVGRFYYKLTKSKKKKKKDVAEKINKIGKSQAK